MSYEIRLTIPEDSSGGHLIASLAAEKHITPSEAVERIVSEAAHKETKRSLSSSGPEAPSELVKRLRAQKAIKGEGPQPPLRTDNPGRIIGLFENAPELVESILGVVESRSDRYANQA